MMQVETASAVSGRPWLRASGSGERELVARAVAGERRAVAELWRRVAPRVHAIARAMTRNAAEADDAAQVAMVEIWRHLEGFDGSGALAGWIRVIAWRRIARHLARTRRDARREAADTDDVAAPERDPGARVALGALLRDVPGAQREALWLHHGCGWSIEEVAAHTGAPANTVKSRMRLALAALRSRTP